MKAWEEAEEDLDEVSSFLSFFCSCRCGSSPSIQLTLASSFFHHVQLLLPFSYLRGTLFSREPHFELLLPAFLPVEQGVCRAKVMWLCGVGCLPAPGGVTRTLTFPVQNTHSPSFRGWTMPIGVSTFRLRDGWFVYECVHMQVTGTCKGVLGRSHVCPWGPWENRMCWMRGSGSWSGALSLEYCQVLHQTSQKLWEVERFQSMLLKLGWKYSFSFLILNFRFIRN